MLFRSWFLISSKKLLYRSIILLIGIFEIMLCIFLNAALYGGLLKKFAKMFVAGHNMTFTSFLDIVRQNNMLIAASGSIVTSSSSISLFLCLYDVVSVGSLSTISLLSGYHLSYLPTIWICRRFHSEFWSLFYYIYVVVYVWLNHRASFAISI